MLKNGLLLPFRFYLRPTRLAREIAAFDSAATGDFSLWWARHQLQSNPAFRAALGRLVSNALVAVWWGPLLAWLFSLFGVDINWEGVALGVAFGMIFGAVFSATLSIAFGIAFGIAFAIAFGVAFGITLGESGAVTGSIVPGLGFGIAGGAAFGASVGTIRSVRFGVLGGVAFAIALGLGRDVARGIAFGITVTLAATHLWLWPFQALLSGCLGAVSRLAPTHAPRLWRLSPVRWDEVILLPLPGLSSLLVTLYHQAPPLGEAARAEVAEHRYRSATAAQALNKIAREEAAQG